MSRELARNWTRDHVVAVGADLVLLSHVGIEGGREAVSRYDAASTMQPEELHRAIVADAENYCSALPGAQRFHVASLSKGEDERDRNVLRTITFMLDGGGSAEYDEHGGNVLSEPPTQTGIVSMLMRHLESRERSLNAVVHGTLAHAGNVNRELRDENVVLRRELKEVQEASDKHLERKHERALEFEKEKHRAEQVMMGLNKIMPYLSSALNMVTGKPMVHQVKTNVDLAALALIQNMPPTYINDVMTDPRLPQQFKVAISALADATNASLSPKGEAEQNAADAARVVNGDTPTRN